MILRKWALKCLILALSDSVTTLFERLTNKFNHCCLLKVFDRCKLGLNFSLEIQTFKLPLFLKKYKFSNYEQRYTF